MTFNAQVPQGNQSPNLFPPQNRTNMTRLKALIAVDHQFNDSAQSTDGFHNVVHLINATSSPPIPAGANSVLYSLNVALGTGTSRDEVSVKGGNGISLIGERAYVWFTVSGGGSVTVQSTHNVASVTRLAQGEFRVSFTDPLLTAKYATLVTAQPLDSSGSGAFRFGSLGNATDYPNAQTVNNVTIQFQNSDGSFRDPTSAAVFVFGG